MNGTCNSTIFWIPTPWGPGEGPKGLIKHIRGDFHSVAWVMPQGWDLGVQWGVGGPKTFFSEIQLDLVCELLT